jgi:hypothetical protein
VFNRSDESIQSFLFTLRNPDNVPARRFALKVEKKDRAIGYWFGLGPDVYEIRVFDKRKANANIGTSKFHYSTDDTRLDENALFSGSQKLSVREIEASKIMTMAPIS